MLARGCYDTNTAWIVLLVACIALVKWNQTASYDSPTDTRKVVRWTAPDYDVVSRVHEYGGGSFTVYNNTLFFSRGEDDAMYRQDGPAAQPSRLTQGQNKRYADGVYNPEVSVTSVQSDCVAAMVAACAGKHARWDKK